MPLINCCLLLSVHYLLLHTFIHTLGAGLWSLFILLLSWVILLACILKTSPVIELENFNSIYNIFLFQLCFKTFSLSPPDANMLFLNALTVSC